MQDESKTNAQGGSLYKSFQIEITPGEAPTLLSVHEIKPRSMRSTKFGGTRQTADTDHQDAGGDGVDGVDHGD